MTDVLDKIIEGVWEGLVVRETKISYGEIKGLSLKTPSLVDAAAALVRSGIQAIVEVKHASPPRGELADTFLPDVLAAECEQSGATVISCLTEERRFRDSLAGLDAIHRAVNIPVLRKGFIVIPHQVHEARVHGADLVLLICSASDQLMLESPLDRTESFGVDALVKAHTAEGVECAEAAGAKILGVSVRSLKALDVDLSVYERFALMLPDHVVKAVESGVKGPGELRHHASRGTDAMPVGEGLVTAGKPGEAR